MRNLTLLVLLFVNFSIFAHHPQNNIINSLNYSINLDISNFEDEYIQGNAKITFTPEIDDLTTLYFDLLHLEIDSITSDDMHIEDFLYNDTLITVLLGSAIQKSDTVSLTVYYQGNPVTDPSGWGGFYFDSGYAFNLGVGFEDYPHNYGRVWYPCIDNFTDKATYDFIITTRQEHKAVCGGELIEIINDEENHKNIYHWRLEEPIPTYLASVAVGEFVSFDTVYHGIEKDIPIDIYVQPNQVNNAKNSFVNIDTVMSIFENKFGHYRWNRIGFVAVPLVFGAMEHATNVTISGPFINGGLLYEDLFYHEIAHSWFGNLITCETSGDMWINEGWAKYSESIYREFLYGRSNMLSFRRGAHNRVLRYYHIQDGGFHALYDVPSELTYSRTVYEKGASVAHSIRGYIGDDDLFFDAIKGLMEEYEFDNLNSYQFRDFLSDFTGIDMTDFFDVHVFGKGFVHYSIDSVEVIPSGNVFDVTVFMRQKLYGRDGFANSNRIPVSFFDEELNDTTIMFKFNGEYGENTYILDFNPILVLTDYYETFSDATNKQSAVIIDEGSQIFSNLYFRADVNSVNESNPALLKVTHNWVAPDEFKEERPGLILADHRYWKVEGNFPEGFSSSARFEYRNSVAGEGILGHLDNDFITQPFDSLVLVYRPHASSDWEILTNAENQWSLSFSRFLIDSLMPGEYSLAMYDWDNYYSNVSNYIVNTEELKIFPNPNTGNFSVKLNADNAKSEIVIYNPLGQALKTKKIENPGKQYLKFDGFTKGQYFVVFIENGKIKAGSKVIVY